MSVVQYRREIMKLGIPVVQVCKWKRPHNEKVTFLRVCESITANNKLTNRKKDEDLQWRKSFIVYLPNHAETKRLIDKNYVVINDAMQYFASSDEDAYRNGNIRTLSDIYWKQNSSNSNLPKPSDSTSIFNTNPTDSLKVTNAIEKCKQDIMRAMQDSFKAIETRIVGSVSLIKHLIYPIFLSDHKTIKFDLKELAKDLIKNNNQDNDKMIREHTKLATQINSKLDQYIYMTTEPSTEGGSPKRKREDDEDMEHEMSTQLRPSVQRHDYNSD